MASIKITGGLELVCGRPILDKPAIFFTVSCIFRAALAPEDAHNICSSEQLVPIVNFPDRESAQGELL